MRIPQLALIVSLTCLVISCTKSPEQATVEPQLPTLQQQKLGSIAQVHALGDIFLTGQPTPENLSVLKQQGIKTIVNLRTLSEVDWDESGEIDRLGMRYLHVPLSSADDLKPEVFEQLFASLRDKQQHPLVLHCGSANRVGAVWFAYRMLEDQLAHDDALAEAKTVGLRSPEYTERAEQYVEQMQK